MIKELAGEIEKLKMDLVATREKNGVYLSVESHEQVPARSVRRAHSSPCAHACCAAAYHSSSSSSSSMSLLLHMLPPADCAVCVCVCVCVRA